MHEKSDVQLLRDYATHANEAAFREIVNRHAALVYSSALRQVTSPDLARDVAQSIFTDLARKAPALVETLTENSSLIGWLYRSTRFTALNQLRDDRRRLARERQVMQHFNPATETAPDWDQVQPVLDEAMADLSDEDRDALLLRYFKNHDFRAIGSTLGVSDDAAQKRVTRALERLRAHLTRRGVTTTALALSTALTANAVPLAPVGLAATLSTTALAGTTLAASATIIATKAIAMTTLQKTAITATLAALASVGIYEARQASQLREQNQTLQQQQTPLSEQVGLLSRALEDATNQIAALRDDNERLNRNTGELLKLRGEVARLRNDANEQNDPTKTAAQSWLNRVSQLKQRLDQSPEANIPELKFIETEDWLAAVKNRQLETDIDYRRAFSSLRKAGENVVASDLKKALKEYLKNNGGQFPTDLTQLQPYLSLSIDDQIFKRWEIAPAKKVPSLGVGGDWIITQKSAVDDVFDTRFGIGPDGFGSTDFLSREVAPTMNTVWDAYKTAHNGQWPDDVSQLQPYATTPEQQAALQKLIMRNSNPK